ncbi:hypothetical protein KY285_021284 [Solanum tuberosum]|nr:hypothetical protein KY285_021284 [Solanum tuberosum]
MIDEASLNSINGPGSVLVPIQLKGSENYGLWRRLMCIALQANRKLCFVLGTCKKSSFEKELQEHWETYNAIVLSWIINTVPPHLISGILYATDAHTVWEDLQERFDKVNRVRIFQLHRDIAMISQGTDTVSTYFTKLKELWAEYDAIVPFPNCGCARYKEYTAHLQQQKLLQFLSGLNDTYTQSKRQILMKTTEPSLNQGYAMIIEEESHRFVSDSGRHGIGEGNDIAAFWSARGSDSSRSSGNINGTSQFRGSTPNRTFQKPKRNWNDQCDHCKMYGHTAVNCYQLIGYPDNFKGKRKPLANNAIKH